MYLTSGVYFVQSSFLIGFMKCLSPSVISVAGFFPAIFFLSAKRGWISEGSDNQKDSDVVSDLTELRIARSDRNEMLYNDMLLTLERQKYANGLRFD